MEISRTTDSVLMSKTDIWNELNGKVVKLMSISNGSVAILTAHDEENNRLYLLDKMVGEENGALG